MLARDAGARRVTKQYGLLGKAAVSVFMQGVGCRRAAILGFGPALGRCRQYPHAQRCI